MTNLAEVRERFLAAQLEGDRRKALDIITRLPVPEVAASDVRAEVIRPAQETIGRLWQTNEISIAQEHVATAISHLALASIYEREAPRPPNGKLVAVACVDGEQHEFPARLVADELESAGFDVRFLGASVPLDHLLSFIERSRPDLVVLSATLALHADSVRATVRGIRAQAGPGLPIAVGGQVCRWVTGLASELDVELSGCDAAALVTEASALLGISG